MALKLVQGNTYYKLTFADPGLTMPGITPLVYIGKNAFYRSMENDRDTHQFQDTVSFSRFGYIMDSDNKEECYVEIFEEEDLGSSLLALDDLPMVISMALQRANEQNWPSLFHLKGNWETSDSETWVQITNADESKQTK